jgi:hypothetical protein
MKTTEGVLWVGSAESDNVAGLSAPLARYCILYATLYAGFGVQSPFLPELFRAHGLRAEELVVGIGTAVRLVSGIAANALVDRLDASRSIFGGLRGKRSNCDAVLSAGL